MYNNYNTRLPPASFHDNLDKISWYQYNYNTRLPPASFHDNVAMLS